jgi:hypothetical protein
MISCLSRNRTATSMPRSTSANFAANNCRTGASPVDILALASGAVAPNDSRNWKNRMNLNDLANLGQIIGALAVVISLFYVASQIRQNTNAVRSATAQTVHEHFAKWYHLVAADDELSQIVAKG